MTRSRTKSTTRVSKRTPMLSRYVLDQSTKHNVLSNVVVVVAAVVVSPLYSPQHSIEYCGWHVMT
jgi:hypothetical protein